MLMSATTMSMALLASNKANASNPSPANKKLIAPSRIWWRNFCRTRALISGSSSTTRICAVMRLVRLAFRSRYAAPQSLSVWSEARRHRPRWPCAWSRHRRSGDHNDRHVGARRPCLGQELETAHARHVDVGENQDERGGTGIGDALERCGGGLSKFHRETLAAQLPPELLAKQHFNVWLVIDHKNKKRHALPPTI